MDIFNKNKESKEELPPPPKPIVEEEKKHCHKCDWSNAIDNNLCRNCGEEFLLIKPQTSEVAQVVSNFVPPMDGTPEPILPTIKDSLTEQQLIALRLGINPKLDELEIQEQIDKVVADANWDIEYHAKKINNHEDIIRKARAVIYNSEVRCF